MKTKTIRNVIIFSVVVMASGWIGLLVDRVLKDQPEGDTLGMGLWLIMPLIAVILLRWFAGDGWKDTGFRLHFKGNMKWYAAALVIFPFVTAVMLLVGALFDWIDFSNLQWGSFGGVFFSLLVGLLIKNFFEEAVWRGYLTSKLLQLKLKDSSIYLIAGAIWGGWHIPYYLYFLPTEDMYAVLPVNKIIFAAVAIATMIGWSIMYVELYRATSSIWPCVLMHAVEDALVNPLVIDGYISIASGKEIFVSPITGLLATLLYIVIGLMMRAKRIRKLSPALPA